MSGLDHASRDLEGAAHMAGIGETRDDYPQRERRSVSGTSSCRGCSDPTCGYCDEVDEPTREQQVDAERDKIERSDRDLLDCLDCVFVEDREQLIADAMRLALQRDDLAACDRLREALLPHVSALAERRAA